MKIKLNKPFAANSAVDEFDVKQIKKALNRLGYYQPFEKVGVTGIPDAGVFEGLKSFQKDHGLQATGTARPRDETISKLGNEAGKKKKRKYIWRTVGDSKVRSSHAALDGTVRDLSDSPDPGEEFNCRCWAEFIDEKNIKKNCDNEKRRKDEAQQKVKELSERLNDLLLRLDKLIEQNNQLVANAQKSLGVRIVSYILTLPFDRLGFLGELLQRYFESIISAELIDAAENFMRQLWATKQKAQHVRDQIQIVFSQLEHAAKELEGAEKRLEECQKNAKE